MDFLLEIAPALEQEVFHQVANLLNLEVDLLFFDTTSTYFCLDEADEPVARDGRGRPPVAARGDADRGTSRRHRRRLPHLRQEQGPPGRSAPDRDRHGRDPGGHPGAGVVVAGEHLRLGPHPPGEGGSARLDPRPHRLGGRPGLLLGARTAATCAGVTTTTSSERSCARAPPSRRPPSPGRAATRKCGRTCA